MSWPASERWKHLAYRSGHFVNSVLRNLPYPVKRRVLAFAPTPVPREAVHSGSSSSSRNQELLWIASGRRGVGCTIPSTSNSASVFTSTESAAKSTTAPFNAFFRAPNCATRARRSRLCPRVATISRRFRPREYVTDAARWRCCCLVQQQSNVLFSDPDILVFRAPTEIIENLQGANAPLYCEEFGTAWSRPPWILEKLERRGLPHHCAI